MYCLPYYTLKSISKTVLGYAPGCQSDIPEGQIINQIGINDLFQFHQRTTWRYFEQTGPIPTNRYMHLLHFDTPILILKPVQGYAPERQMYLPSELW